MDSITATPIAMQEETGPNSTLFNQLPIAEKGGTPASLDHELDEETRRRLDEWRSMAANLSHGFTQMPNQVRADPTLSTSEKVIYEHLLGYMWQREWCWPSQERIAKELGLSRRTVIRALKELYGRCYIEKWRRGLGKTNVYFVNPLSFVASFKQPGRGAGVLVAAHGPEHQSHPSTTPAPDVLLSFTMKCQNDTSRCDIVSHLDAPNCHTKHTKQETHKMMDTASKNSTDPEKGTGVGGTTIRSVTKQQANEETTQEPTKPSNQANQDEKAAAAPVQTHQPSAQAQAIAAQTGIPAAHLEELGIAPQPRRRSVPDFVCRTMIDFTRDLGDASRSAKSNATRAAKLYYFGVDYCKDAQEDPEGWFLGLLYQIKGVALQATNVRHRTGNRINRMPLFFSELEKLFGFNDDEWAYIRSDLAMLEPEDRP